MQGPVTLACRIRRRQRRDERRAASTKRAPWGERRSGRRGNRGRARRAPARRREGRAPQPPPLAAFELWEVSRGRPGRASARRYDLPLFANAKVKAPGPRVVLSAAIKQSWAAPRGTKGPKARGASRGRHIEPAGRAPPARASCARGRAYRDFRAPPKALVPGNSTSKRKAPQKGRRRWWEGSASVGFPPP